MATGGDLKPTEKELTASIRQALDVCGIFHWKQWQGPMSQPRGVSDIIGCYQGRFFALEIKLPGRKPTPDQERLLRDVERAGGIAILAYSLEDALRGLQIEDRFLF